MCVNAVCESKCSLCVSGAQQEEQQQEEEEEEQDEDEGSVQLQMEEVTLRTLDLREHEINLGKKKRRKRKERKPEVTEKEEREGTVLPVKKHLTVFLILCVLYINFYLYMHVVGELKDEAGSEKEAEEKMKDKKHLKNSEHDDEGEVHHAFKKIYS